MQAVAVIEQRVERLQGGANIVKADLLGVQTPSGGLNVVLQHLATRAGTIPLAHRTRPNAPRDPTDNAVFGIHSIGEKEAQVGRKIIDSHAAREVILNNRKAV